MRFKTKTAAISHAFLQGDVITIMDGFKRFAVTNLPRECGRAIERKFNVKISKVRKDFVSPNGHAGFYYEYKLNKVDYNKIGIEAMWSYVSENLISPSTDKSAIRNTTIQKDLFDNV